MTQFEPAPREERNEPRDVTRMRSRPHDQWICGYAPTGQCGCAGPTADGRCGRISSRVCDDRNAPKPCIPRRSERYRREVLTVNVAVMVCGILLLCMALPTREAAFVPGELSSKHAQILNNTLVSERCSACHPSVHGTESKSVTEANPDASSNWFTRVALRTAGSLIENDGRQDELCMQCHKSHMPAAAFRVAHDLTSEQWNKLLHDPQAPAWQLVSTLKPDSPEHANQAQQQTACATCHIEHHGRQFDLKFINNTRCQACHKRQFESLASGHPEFTNFPVDRPRSLMFSHARHKEEHFTKKNRNFDCKACHVSPDKGGPYGMVTRSLSFETVCASCHVAPIRASSTEGWALLQLPSIDSATIDSSPLLENWPANAQFGFDGEVSPVLRALLMADESLALSLSNLPDSGKIVDISTISDQRSTVGLTIAVATRQLIEETARDGQAAWLRRLEVVTKKQLGRDLNQSEQALLERMCSGLPPDLFRQSKRDWFAHDDTATNTPSTDAVARTARKTQIVRQPESSSDNDLLITDSPASSTSDDDLLLGSPGDELSDQFAKPETQSSASQPSIKGPTHLSGGGWFLDQATLTVRYRPTGHADALQSAWAQWWNLVQPVSIAQTSVWSEHQQMSQASRIPGNCSQCHQLDNQLLDWRAYRVVQRSKAEKEFTKFDHTPHLALPAVNDCRFCHQLKDDNRALSIPAGNDKLVSLKSLDPYPQSTSEFASQKLHQCASCHRSGGANDGCLQCHNYHIQLPTEPMAP